MTISAVRQRLIPILIVAGVLVTSFIARPLGPHILTTACSYGYLGAPTVTGVSPNVGPLAGGTSVTVSGCGFTGATSVHFGTTVATFSVTNDSSVHATSPAHAAGTVDITVTTASGTSAVVTADQFTYTNLCTSTTSSAAPVSPQAAGTVVTLSAVAVTCPNPRYQFWILPPGGSWTIVQAYSASASFTWHTIGDPAGTYMWTVWARDNSSTANLDSYAPGVSYVLSLSPCTSTTSSASPTSPQLSGTVVTLTGVASGCPNPRYQFWILPPGGTWTIVQAYSATATFTWNTIHDPAGTYMWTVWARDNSSTANLDSYAPGVAYVLTTSPCTSVTASATPASPQAHGTVITITAVAVGCPSPQYQFWILPPGGQWTIVQAYSGTATFTWTTTGDPAGVYMWTVWVRDNSSTASFDKYTPGASYTLT